MRGAPRGAAHSARRLRICPLARPLLSWLILDQILILIFFVREGARILILIFSLNAHAEFIEVFFTISCIFLTELLLLVVVHNVNQIRGLNPARGSSI